MSPSNGAAAGSLSILARGSGAGTCSHHGRALSVLSAGRFPRGPAQGSRSHAAAPSSSQPVHGNIRHGFVYERVPHITLKSIANNAEIDVIWEKWQEKLEPSARVAEQPRSRRPGKSGKSPARPMPKWSDAAKKLHADWWEARIARQKEIDASIAAKAEFEYLYDKPYDDKKNVRVAGPFTVESLSPHRVSRRRRERRADRPLEKQPNAGYGDEQRLRRR